MRQRQRPIGAVSEATAAFALFMTGVPTRIPRGPPWLLAGRGKNVRDPPTARALDWKQRIHLRLGAGCIRPSARMAGCVRAFPGAARIGSRLPGFLLRSDSLGNM